MTVLTDNQERCVRNLRASLNAMHSSLQLMRSKNINASIIIANLEQIPEIRALKVTTLDDNRDIEQVQKLIKECFAILEEIKEEING